MTILKKGTKIFSFDKTRYNQAKIGEEYDQKAKSLLRGRKVSELGEEERKAYKQIYDDFFRDPRRPNTYWLTEEAALKAKKRADELESNRKSVC